MMDENFQIDLSIQEKKICLLDIKKKIVKSLYVYEQNQMSDSKYNYKEYIQNLIYFVKSSNDIFEGELTNIIVSLNSILINDFNKRDFRKIILDIKNFLDYKIKLIEEAEV